MSNRPYDESVDAIDGDEIVTPRTPDEAEDLAHHKTPITGSHRQHDEDLEHEIEEGHPESPHDLEGKRKRVNDSIKLEYFSIHIFSLGDHDEPREASLHDSHGKILRLIIFLSN